MKTVANDKEKMRIRNLSPLDAENGPVAARGKAGG